MHGLKLWTLFSIDRSRYLKLMICTPTHRKAWHDISSHNAQASFVFLRIRISIDSKMDTSDDTLEFMKNIAGVNTVKENLFKECANNWIQHVHCFMDANTFFITFVTCKVLWQKYGGWIQNMWSFYQLISKIKIHRLSSKME